jgi:hypothetical protein
MRVVKTEGMNVRGVRALEQGLHPRKAKQRTLEGCVESELLRSSDYYLKVPGNEKCTLPGKGGAAILGPSIDQALG